MLCTHIRKVVFYISNGRRCMPNKPNTRSNKTGPILKLSNQELGKLERENRKAAKSLKMVNPIILMRDEDGALRDQEGHLRNEQGQKIDAEGNVIAEIAVVDEPADGVDGVDRHQPGGIDRHPSADVRGAANHVQNPVRRQENNRDLIRTIADYNRADLVYENWSAIVPPPFQRNDFELKPAYFQLVGQRPFSALPNEKPLDHIEHFEDLVTSIKANGVTEDFIFCKLFPYSLAGEASQWLKQLPAGSLTSWQQVKVVFLNHFYDDAMSDELRVKLSTFKQRPDEAFKAAWVRFKAYQRDCPHHGFSRVQLLSIFFRGCDWKYQLALDAASHGNFKTRMPEDAEVLIENLASSNSTKGADAERKRLHGEFDANQLASVSAKLDSMHNLLVGKKSVQFAAEVETFEPEPENSEENVNYVYRAGYQGKRFGNQQGNRPYNGDQKQQQNNGYTRTYGNSSYQSPPPKNSSESRMEAMLEQFLQGQENLTVTFNGKIDNVYTELNGKIEALNVHVKKLEIQVAQTAGSVKRQESVLPARTDSNPRHACNAISVRDEDDGEIASAQKEEKSTNLSVSNDAIDRHHLGVDRHSSQTEPKAAKSQVPTVERVYKPKVPFPKPRKSKQEMEEARCKAMMDKVMIEMPLIDAVKLSPPLKRYVRRMVSNGLSPEEGALITKDVSAILLNQPVQRKKEKKQEVVVSKKVSAIIQCKTAKKLLDPGSFVLDCFISTGRFAHSLCDLGSSINLMPHSVAVRLGMTEFKPTQISLILADRSRRIPEGVLEDIPVKVGNFMIPTDFVVLKYDIEPKDPLILGRSFLATAGAVIDVQKGHIALNVDGLSMSFEMDTLRRAPTIDGQTFSVEKVSATRASGSVSIDATKRVSIDTPPRPRQSLSKTDAPSQKPIPKQKSHHSTLQSPQVRSRYASSSPKLPPIINKNFKEIKTVLQLTKPRDYRRALVSSVDDFAGHKRYPPIPKSCLGPVPNILGKPHAPNAYTPPWMKRISMPCSDPPDA